MDTDTPTPTGPTWLLASPTIALIACALAEAQGEMEDAAKDRANPHFNSRYADLASVVQAVRTPLSKHGIAFLQPTSFDAGRVVVRTILVHKSGEWMASELSAKAQQDTPQGIGSTITYLRRYSLMSMTGIAPDDDDGEAGDGRAPAPKQAQPPRPAPKREAPAPAPAAGPHHPSWVKDNKAFCAAVTECGLTYNDVADWCEALNRSRPSVMDAGQRGDLLAYLYTPEGKAAVKAFASAVPAK